MVTFDLWGLLFSFCHSDLNIRLCFFGFAVNLSAVVLLYLMKVLIVLITYKL